MDGNPHDDRRSCADRYNDMWRAARLASLSAGRPRYSSALAPHLARWQTNSIRSADSRKGACLDRAINLAPSEAALDALDAVLSGIPSY